jgi:hypothetical protein
MTGLLRVGQCTYDVTLWRLRLTKYLQWKGNNEVCVSRLPTRYFQ